MADLPSIVELELLIGTLPLLSRAAHLAGPSLHAERLVALWRSADLVPLSDAFRLLDAKAVAGAIVRTIAASEHGYPDARYWRFPDLETLLPELRARVWQEICAGRMSIKANGRTLTQIALDSVTPDWPTSRLLGRTKPLVKVTVCLLPTAAVKPARKPAPAVVARAAKRIAERHAERRHLNAPLPFDDFWQQLKDELPGFTVTQLIARQALNDVPQLRGKRGYRRKQRS